MKASTIAALLAFAAAARHSPEPSRSVADLAELIATHEADQEEPAAATADPVATDPAAGVEVQTVSFQDVVRSLSADEIAQLRDFLAKVDADPATTETAAA